VLKLSTDCSGFYLYTFRTLVLNAFLLLYLIIILTCRDLVGLLAGAVAGIHSMTDEHFGISVVEYMAAGAIPIGRCDINLPVGKYVYFLYISCNDAFTYIDHSCMFCLLCQLIIQPAQKWTLYWMRMNSKQDFSPALLKNMQTPFIESLRCQRQRDLRWLLLQGDERAGFLSRSSVMTSKPQYTLF